MFRKLFEKFEAKRVSGRPSVEGLEDRRLLSGNPVLINTAAVLRQTSTVSTHSSANTTEAFSAAPAAVQAGLNAIAPSTIDATETVYVHTVNSTTSLYSVRLASTSST